jgi:transposase
MGSTRRSFSAEYKAQAVAYVLEEGRSRIEVARNIGIHENTLGKWLKQVRKAEEPEEPAKSGAGSGLSEAERLELIRLRAQVKDDKATIAELQMQVDFAKKVATWFAKGKQ